MAVKAWMVQENMGEKKIGYFVQRWSFKVFETVVREEGLSNWSQWEDWVRDRSDYIELRYSNGLTRRVDHDDFMVLVYERVQAWETVERLGLPDP